VALIERDLMGGDCLNVGCVPSKAVIAASRSNTGSAQADSGGFDSESQNNRFKAAMERMRRLRAEIAPHDSADRFRDLGVDVYFGAAAFTTSSSVQIDSSHGDRTLDFRKALIATGARASAPPIAGLETIDYLTNETVFSLTDLPARLGVIGSGPIGCELSQAFANLGSQVYLFERGDRVLSAEDPDASHLVLEALQRDGVQVKLGANDIQLNKTDRGISISTASGETIVDKLLVAVGRAPNVDGLGLENAGVKFSPRGVEVNDYLQTTNSSIYAAGDVCSQFKFTHAADFQARAVIQNALFAIGPIGRRKSSDLIIPWATYTTPEVAHVGLTAAEVKSRGSEIDTYTQPFSGVDRNLLEGDSTGYVRVYTPRGRDTILGATIVGHRAGDMISELTLAMSAGIGLSKIGSVIHPYPTSADAIRRLGDQYSKTRLTSHTRRLLSTLMRLNVGT
ncbi:MAG TPA: FAD-containing oxidoreductase, partial [Planctomycetaceae bacterium]|nr:FAD-containing oxidoreductase [Planctomycetaceae bacterium]